MDQHVLEERIRLLRQALGRMTYDKYHSMDPGTYEQEAEQALQKDDALASKEQH